MIIKNKYFDKYFSNFYEKDRELMLKHYYCNHEIISYPNDAVIKDKKNIGIINEIEGKFFVSLYQLNVPIAVSSLKEVNKVNVGWEYIGCSNDDGIEYFSSYEEAKKYILILSYKNKVNPYNLNKKNQFVKKIILKVFKKVFCKFIFNIDNRIIE